MYVTLFVYEQTHMFTCAFWSFVEAKKIIAWSAALNRLLVGGPWPHWPFQS